MKTLAGISILALLTISGRPIPTGFSRATIQEAN
jgi:hypothetical protein